jgi:hypothetical protein
MKMLTESQYKKIAALQRNAADAEALVVRVRSLFTTTAVAPLLAAPKNGRLSVADLDCAFDQRQVPMQTRVEFKPLLSRANLLDR